jgi:hypothetical protein
MTRHAIRTRDRSNHVVGSAVRTTPRSKHLMIALACLALYLPSFISCFSPLQVRTCSRLNVFLAAAYDPSDMEDEINQRLKRARALLETTKAKLAAKESESEDPLPFFASKETPKTSNRDGIVKSRDEETGLITADGEKMAALSEEEEWEARSILRVFDGELDGTEDVYSMASEQLASRDVAASIWGLRRSLHIADYLKIFDKKNFFIGEDN